LNKRDRRSTYFPTAVEIEPGIAITAATVVELYRSTWEGPLALVIQHDDEHRLISLVRVERP
jgi:hypothetical protein